MNFWRYEYINVWICELKGPWVAQLYYSNFSFTAEKMKFSIKAFFSKCDQIHSFQQIWSHLLKKSWMKNFIFM